MAKRKNRKPRARVDPRRTRFKALDDKFYFLTSKQKYWCEVYLEEGTNLTIASLEAYKVTNKHLCKIPWKLLTDNEKRKRMSAENTASKIGQENLRKPPIFKYIDKVLSDEGYTDDVVRLLHFRNMKQGKSVSASNQAIDMYYKKRGAYKPEEHIITNKLTDELLDRIIKD